MIQVGEHVLEVTVRALDEDGHALIGVLNTFGGKKIWLLMVPRDCRITYGRKNARCFLPVGSLVRLYRACRRSCCIGRG